MADLNFGKLRQDAMTVLEGEFVVRITEATATKNSKGNPMIKAKMAIAAGPYTGRTLNNNFSITLESSNAMKMFFSQMNALGLDGAYFDKLPNGETGVTRLAQDMVGRMATVTLGKGSWQGVEREEVQGFAPAPAGLGGGAPSGLPTAQPLTVPTAIPTAPAAALPVTGSADVSLPIAVGTTPEPELQF